MSDRAAPHVRKFLGQRLRELRKQRGLSQERLGDRSSLSGKGSYTGGHMLFLGLGTGLGSALIVDGVLEPMELAHLPYKKGRTYEEQVGKAALKRVGKKKWLGSNANAFVGGYRLWKHHA